MNNDLVKRIAVCDMLHAEMGAWGSCVDEIDALLKANDALWEIPAVDAVEVVRCCECKYRNKAPCPMRLSLNWTEDNDFCSYGERKDGADG